MEAQRPPDRARPMCHGGALDPFAEGLLLVLSGDATRLFPHLHGVPKVYRATLAWGRETDTGDLHGRTVAEGSADRLDPPLLEAALHRMEGWQDQVPPATSNKRIGGERAYEKAHRGERFTLPAARTYLHAARWLEHRLPEASELEVSVIGGFYVRSLARDLGRDLGVPAHLRRLDRRAIGPWTDPGPGQTASFEGEALLPWCPARPLSTDERARLRLHGSLPSAGTLPADWPLPEGFPAPAVRLLYRRRLVGLAEGGDPLRVTLLLGAGL